MSKVDELIERAQALLNPEITRKALTDKKDALSEQLAERVLSLSLEFGVKDETATTAQKKTIMKTLRAQIEVLSAAIEEINRRLSGADDILTGYKPNRKVRRHAQRNGVK